MRKRRQLLPIVSWCEDNREREFGHVGTWLPRDWPEPTKNPKSGTVFSTVPSGLGVDRWFPPAALNSFRTDRCVFMWYPLWYPYRSVRRIRKRNCLTGMSRQASIGGPTESRKAKAWNTISSHELRAIIFQNVYKLNVKRENISIYDWFSKWYVRKRSRHLFVCFYNLDKLFLFKKSDLFEEF